MTRRDSAGFMRLRNHWSSFARSPARAPTNNSVATHAAPNLPVTAEWDEAFRRVESYLHAHQIESRVLVNQLTTEMLNDARAAADQAPGEQPVTLAMRIAHARIGGWLKQAFADGDWADERFRARGRLALLRSELPQRCPERFLSREPLPPEFAAELVAAHLSASPELRPTPMPPAELEFPLAEMVEERWVTFSRSTFVRAAASWIVFVGFLGVAWFATR
jgi:hypothetical protein